MPKLKTNPAEGDLRVWWIPQIPATPSFEVDVSSLEEAALLMTTLANYDAFQLQHRVKPDYCNAGGLNVFENGEWVEWYDHDTGDTIDDWMRANSEEKEAALSRSGNEQNQTLSRTPTCGMEFLMTFDDVIEKHRVLAGAERLNVTLGPEATPGKLDAELTRIADISASYGSYRPEERANATIARLRGTMREIDRAARAGDVGKILSLTDIFVDADLEVDIAWMRAEREKRGEPLPETVQ